MMQMKMVRRGVEHTYMTVFLEDEMQHYRVHHSSGIVQRRFGLQEEPHWARVHPDRATAVCAAIDPIGVQ
jgi:hypothetical protein